MAQASGSGRAHARRRHHDVFSDVLRGGLGKLDAVELGAAVEAPQQIGQGLAEMAEHELGAGEPVEVATEHQPQRVGAGLEAPFPGGAPQPDMPIKRRGWRHRVGGMDVDRLPPTPGLVPERLQRRVVEILAIGVAVDHGAAELQLAHGSARARQRRRRRPAWQDARSRYSGPAAFAISTRQEIIRLTRFTARGLGVRLGLHAGSGQRQDRARDARAIHGRKPQVRRNRTGERPTGCRSPDRRRRP